MRVQRFCTLALCVLALVGGSLVLSGASCRVEDGDGDVDADTDVDGDVDGDGDADSDSDLDDDWDHPGIHVLTWNLRTFPATSSTVATVAGVLNDLEVDLIALQEIEDNGAFVDLLGLLEGFDGTIADDPGADSHVGLLYRQSAMTIANVETIYEDDWYAFPRAPLVARMSVQGRGAQSAFDFFFVVVHLKAQMDEESEDRRRTACERLDEWISQRGSESGEQDFVVVGDMNDRLTAPASDNVFQVFLDQPDRYRFLTMDLASQGAYSYIPFESMIDHVLVTTDALDEYGDGETEVLALESSVPSYQSTVSDHRPVMAYFEIP